MATVMKQKSIMMNSTVFKILLLLYLATIGPVMSGNVGSFSLECGNILNTTKDSTTYTLELGSNTSYWCICHRTRFQTLVNNTACNYDEFNDNCSISCIDNMHSSSQPNHERTLIIASVAILIVLLGVVILCWIGTYRAMKKRIKVLQNTLATSNTGNSLTIDTNNREPNREPHNQLLCFQNASYEQNSSSFSQSPAPECPETNIYDLPFQIPAGVNKEKPKSQEALPKGSIRYKAQTLPKGSIRYTANTPKSGEESKNECKSAPESPRANEIEFLCSGKEQQWVAATEYEVPITQQDTQN